MNQSPSNKIVVFGTNHKFQWGELKTPELTAELNALIQEHGIKLLGDEIDNLPTTQSVVKDVAAQNAIQYLVIEPTREEKAELGIEEIHNIEYELDSRFELDGKYDTKTWPKEVLEELNLRTENSYRQREKEWISRIEQASKWPALVVCGSVHFEEFCALLESKGYEVIRAHNYWGQDYIDE